MLKLRRNPGELRLEIVPLIDVIFLLLTFFIYAMVLMVRVDLLPVDLGALTSGAPATPTPAVSLTIRLDGSLYLDRQPIAIDDVEPRLKTIVAERPQTSLYLALEDGEGSIDRGPVLQQLWDRLSHAGLEIKFVGRPGDSPGGG